jgi:GT2 family glycosyltransferase
LYLNSALREVGFLDETTYHFYAGDIDVCLKLANAGYQIIAAENSYVEHYAHANFRARFKNNKQHQETDQLALIKKWSFRYGLDPANYARKTFKKDFQDATYTIRKFYWRYFWNGWEYPLYLYKLWCKFKAEA